MTIKEYKEYLAEEIHDAKYNINAPDVDSVNEMYYRGKADAFKEALSVLRAEVKHELTLRDLKEFCENADCEKCPFAQFDENEDGIRFQCNCDLDAPKYHDVDEVTKKVREASHVS